MTADSLAVLLSQSWTNKLFHTGSNCCLLTHIQVSQETSKVVWYSHFFKTFPQFVVSHTIKGFSVVSEAEVDAFLEVPCFFYEQINVGNLISGSSAFSKSSLYIWKISVHILLKLSLKNFEHNVTHVWNECNCSVSEASFTQFCIFLPTHLNLFCVC